jgi:hypothetical protein
MTEDERIVREAWHSVETNGHERFATVRVFCGNDDEWFYGEDQGFFSTEADAMAAARAFTEERKREIAELEQEIGFVAYYLEETEHAVWKRLRDRLTVLLEEKRKGWKL